MKERVICPAVLRRRCRWLFVAGFATCRPDLAKFPHYSKRRKFRAKYRRRMKTQIRRIATCAAVLVLDVAGGMARAQDYPEIRLLHGVTGEDSILLECAPTTNANLECTATQTLVRHPRYHRWDADGILATAERDGEECKTASAVKAALTTGFPPSDPHLAEFTRRVKSMPQGQAADIEADIDATIAMCRHPSRSTATALRRLKEDKDLRSCLVSSNRVKEAFGTIDNGVNWISRIGPTGVCGVITVSKIQRTEVSAKDWTYTTQKTVTKRDEMLGDFLSCRAIDETAHSYRAGGGSTYMNCDYINFEYSRTLP